jgi:ribonucleoside-diphosphate reductase alpha chain
MKRVEADAQWSLFSPSDTPELIQTFGDEFEAHYERYEREGKALKQVPARALYARMMQTLAETGNGWMCFKDKANLRSAQTGAAGNVIHSSNLCTEILEVTNADQTAVCNLGSINLASFVTEAGKFDFDKLRKVTATAVKFLDRVVDLNFYPTPEAQASNSKWRPIGLGIMGLQDAFFKLRLPFTGEEAKKLSARISETVYFEAVRTSVEMARKSGPFEAFRESRYAAGDLQVQLARKHQERMPELHEDWEKLAQEVRQTGIRNSLLIAVAPTATIASIMGSYESIEPQIGNVFKRETLSGEFLQVNRYLIGDLKRAGLWNEAMRSKIISADGSIQAIEEIPTEIRELYKTAWEISQKDLIDMAVERSAFICQSQSLNLFMEEPNVGKLSSMYMYAWKQGVKTTYYLRSRAKTSIKKTTVNVPAAETQAPASIAAVAAVACSLENPTACEACQ